MNTFGISYRFNGKEREIFFVNHNGELMEFKPVKITSINYKQTRLPKVNFELDKDLNIILTK